MKKQFLILAILVGSFISCKNKEDLNNVKTIDSSIKKTTSSFKLQYDLNNPIKCSLPNSLLEISALTIDRTTNTIYTVNDEKATIYSLKECIINGDYDFGKKGDFEGIELVGDDLFILKSNGKIIQYNILSKTKVREINNPLTLSNDAEGLGYDQDKNSLLIACKGSPNIKNHEKLKKTKAVYAYDIAQEIFEDKPILTITDISIQEYFEEEVNSSWSKKEQKKRLRRLLEFSPSSIAKNPINDFYYLLSTVGKTLIIIDEDSKIISMEYLDNASFIQPEGICFDNNGDMYISNEGKGLKANILKFIY